MPLRTPISLVLVSATTLCACAHPSQKIQGEPMVFAAKPGGRAELLDADAIFAEAARAFSDQRFADALAGYDRIARDFEGSRLVPLSLYNAGLTLENLDDLDGAVVRYRRLADDFRKSPDALDALFRLASVEEHRKRFAATVVVLDELLARAELSTSDRVEALARRGAALARLGEHAKSERSLRDALDLARKKSSQERLDTDFFVGMATYYLAELVHAEFRALPLRPPEKQLEADLEAKARHLLFVQARYLDTIRVRHPEWATAAGYQLGLLYREFYDALLSAPIDTGIDAETRTLYIEELKKKVRGLLQKALRLHESNLLMAERVGLKNEWVERSTEQMKQLEQLLSPGAAPTAPVVSAPAQPALPEAPARRESP